MRVSSRLFARNRLALPDARPHCRRVRGWGAVLLLLGAALAAGCSDFLTGSDPSSGGVSVSFSLAQLAPGGATEAYGKADQVRVRLVRQSGVIEVLTPFDPSGQETVIPLSITVTTVETAQLFIELLRGSDILFRGSREIELRPVANVAAHVELVPFVAALHIRPSSVDIPSVGQEVLLTAVGAFVTEDTIPGLPVQWSAADGTIVAVNGPRITALREGETQVLARFGDVGGVAFVRVVQVVDRVEVTPAVPPLQIGQTAQLTATPLDARGNAIVGRSIAWVSSAPAVAEVGSTGLVTARSGGSAVISATIDGVVGTRTITVERRPLLVLSPTSVNLGLISFPASTTLQTVQITNGGDGQITGLSAGPIVYGGGASGWLTATLNSATAPATLTLEATGPLSPGTYTATVPVHSPDAENTPQSVTVTLTVTPGAQILLTPSSVDFVSVEGDPSPGSQTVRVTNSGGSTLTGLSLGAIQYSAGASGWLTASLVGTTAPTDLVLAPVTANLPAGTYTALVPVHSSVASNSPQFVSVLLTIARRPQIVLNPDSLLFVHVEGQPDPLPQTVNITNGGDGVLSGLTLGPIDYGTSPGGWLTAALNGTTAPTTMTVGIVHTDLRFGTHTATIPVFSSDAVNSPQPVRVTLVIEPEPQIALSRDSVPFSGVQNGALPPAQTVTITNSGGGVLSGLSASIQYLSGSGWLSATLTSTTAPATLQLAPNTTNLVPGTYRANVLVASPVAGNSPMTVRVTYSVAPQPQIALNPDSVAFGITTITPGGGAAPPPQTVQVTNVGGGTLSGLSLGAIQYGAGASGWLSASLNSTVAPATVTLSVNPAAVTSFGTFTARVPVQSGVASNSPQFIDVTVTQSSSIR